MRREQSGGADQGHRNDRGDVSAGNRDDGGRGNNDQSAGDASPTFSEDYGKAPRTVRRILARTMAEAGLQ